MDKRTKVGDWKVSGIGENPKSCWGGNIGGVCVVLSSARTCVYVCVCVVVCVIFSKSHALLLSITFNSIFICNNI